MELSYTELFYSIQGEGRWMGTPSVFFRTFGCNFRCRKFNRPKDEVIPGHNPEVIEVIKNIDKYKSFKELPVLSTGCDTYASIYPEFKHFAMRNSTDKIVDEMLELLPYNTWGNAHLVITGGEPLLGWQREYPHLLFDSKMNGLTHLTFETNGTQKISKELKTHLILWSNLRGGKEHITFSVSPKLSNSGESWNDAIKPEIITEYQELGHTYLKFVIATVEDAAEALCAYGKYRDNGFKGDVYFMPVGGIESVYSLNNRQVADLALKHGVKYSDRLQVPLYKNAWGT